MTVRRSYAELQSLGATEIDRLLERAAQSHCPNCGHQLTVDGTAGFPIRVPDERALRALDLEPSARRLATELARTVKPATFDIWLGPLTLLDVAAGQLLIGAPQQTALWIAERFTSVISRAATTLAGSPLRVVVSTLQCDARTFADLAIIAQEEAPAA